MSIAGLTWEELKPCVMWMKNHKDIINKFRPCPAGLKTFENVSEAEAHKIQYHTVSKEMWVSESCGAVSQWMSNASETSTGAWTLLQRKRK